MASVFIDNIDEQLASLLVRIAKEYAPVVVGDHSRPRFIKPPPLLKKFNQSVVKVYDAVDLLNQIYEDQWFLWNSFWVSLPDPEGSGLKRILEDLWGIFNNYRAAIFAGRLQQENRRIWVKCIPTAPGNFHFVRQQERVKNR